MNKKDMKYVVSMRDIYGREVPDKILYDRKCSPVEIGTYVLSEFRPPVNGDVYLLDGEGQTLVLAVASSSYYSMPRAIYKKEPEINKTVSMSIDDIYTTGYTIPPGWEAVRFAVPKPGDWVLMRSSEPLEIVSNWDTPRLILKKTE